MNTKHYPSVLEEKITPHLRQLIDQGSKAIELQFRGKMEVGLDKFDNDDPLGEESKYSPFKGIVHKFNNRALVKVSYRCAAHCQFCTRARQIGTSEGDLSNEDVERVLGYIALHDEIDDVILSGGDPFVTPIVARQLLDGLVNTQSVKMIRIGTRLPIHSPASFRSEPVKQLLARITEITKTRPLIVLIHVNHPDELSTEVVEAIKVLKSTGALLMTQTVFLNNINDNVEALFKLFTSAYHLGIIPYYIYHCDSVRGLEHFVVSIEKEQQIVTELRCRLSGIAMPTHVIDVPGKGKIDVPLGFWSSVDLSSCSDYEGTIIDLKNL